MDNLLAIIFVGVVATVFMDLWGYILKVVFSIKGLDYRFVGRWILHMRQGRFLHKKIFDASEVRGEVLIGWLTHYLIGIGFAFLLFIICGEQWFNEPRFLEALTLGLVTVLAPYFVLQPAFGLGIACQNVPNKTTMRLKSLSAHFSYGLGLYLAGQISINITF